MASSQQKLTASPGVSEPGRGSVRRDDLPRDAARDQLAAHRLHAADDLGAAAGQAMVALGPDRG
jgi:hypothetical protein